MTTYVISPRAQADIDGIWDYTAERWNEEQAARYIRALQEAIETVAADPQRGRSCEQIRPGYRKYAAGSHVVFYRATPKGIDVVRVLHQRMDFERHL
jgi:toxin ParE1/3/4